MGWSKVAFKSLVYDIPGVEVVMPPRINKNRKKKLVDEGRLHSPEFVCFPFKVTLGEMIDLYENQGVKNFAMAVDKGPCRFGFYGPVQKRIMHDLGMNDVNFFYIQQDDLRTFEWLDMYSELEKMTGKKISNQKALENVGLFLTKAYYVEKITRIEGLVRCREKEGGETTRTVHKLMNNLDEENNLLKLQLFDKIIAKDFYKIRIDREREPLRVAYTGEIHVFLEQDVNHYLMRELGELGVEVYKSFDVYDWVMHKFDTNKRRKELEKKANKYIPRDIGGEAVWNMGDYLHAQEEGYNGFVHLYPFACMPEVSFKSILDANTENEFYLPHIHFSLDEQSGFEGMRTRIEAFTDLMKENREHNSKFRDIKYETPYELKEIYYKPKTGLEYFLTNIKRPARIVSKLLSPIEFLSKPQESLKNSKRVLEFLLRDYVSTR